MRSMKREDVRTAKAADRGPPRAIVREGDSIPIWSESVQGRSLVEQLRRCVDGLRDEDAHGNRKLHLDDVFVAYLLAFYNPTLRTLRTIEDFSQTEQAQKSLSVPRLCKSTLSDFNAACDPERLRPVLAALRERIERSSPGKRLPSDLAGVVKQVVAVDGTFLPALASVAWSVRSRNQRKGEKRKARLDVHLDVGSWIPEAIVVPEAKQSEASSAAASIVRDSIEPDSIQEGAIYLYDRGFCSFELFAAHFDEEDEPRADFVVRLRRLGRNGPKTETVEERELSEAARQAGVLSDRLVRMPGLAKKSGVDATLREVVVATDDPAAPLRLLTTLLEPPAETIGLLYRLRWQIELFFRWMKSYANFDHLISHSRQGVLLQFYAAIVGVMLTYVATSARPSKYLFSMLSVVAGGGATLEDVLPILRERERRSDLERASAARRRAKKQAGQP